MAYVYLSKDIPLNEDEIDNAVQAAKLELSKLYQEIAAAVPLLEQDAAKIDPDFTIEFNDFDPDMVNCEDWHEGVWNASYMFEISLTSPKGDQDCDYGITQWDEWHRLEQPMYKDVFEPLRQCRWEGFKREGVTVEFVAIKAVDSYSGNGLHFYDNQDWL